MAQRSKVDMRRYRASGLVQHMFCDPNILQHDRDRPSNGTTSVVGQSRRFGPILGRSDLPFKGDMRRQTDSIASANVELLVPAAHHLGSVRPLLRGH